MDIDIKIGAKVFADFTKYSTVDVRQGTVERITPTGIAVINFEGQIYKFRDGIQVTSDRYHKARILYEKIAH